MAEYDPDDQADEREQAGYDQAEAAAQQQLLRGEEPQTFGFNGQPVEQPAQQAIPTAPPPAPQQAAQAAPQQQPSDRYDVVWQQQPAPQAQAQPQQTQQPQPQPRSLTLAPYPGQGSEPRLTARERAAQNREAPYSTTVDTEERYDVAPELRLQPTGGLGSVVALEFENFGHDVLSAVNAFAKNQLNMPVPQLEALNAQFKEHIDKVRDGLDPARRAAQDVSIFDPSSFAGKDAGAVAEAYAVSLATGIMGGLGPGLAAKMAVKTGARVVAGSFAAAGRAADVAAIGTAGAVGAAQQTGARYEDYADTIDKMTDEDKQKSAMYQGFRAQNMDDAAAKEAMKSRFPMLQQLGVNFVTSTGIAAVTPGLGGAMPRLATRGRNIAAGAAEAGGSAGAGTAGSAAIQEQAKVEAGTQPAINWGRVAGEGAVAAGLGAGFGGAFGAFHGTSPREAPPLPRVDNVTPGGVPPEHTAALNAAGIGKPANPTWPGGTGRQDNPTWSGGPPPPPDPTWPRGSVRPPEPPSPPNPTWPERPPETPPQLALPAPALQLTASRERGPGFTMQEPAPAPLQLGVSRERGPGFTVREPDAPPNPTWPGGPVRPPEPLAPAAPTAPVAPPASPNPVWPGRAQLPPDTGPRLLTAARDRGEGFTMAEPAPAALQLTASRERGPGFEALPEGAPVRAYEQPAGPPTPPPRLPPETTPRLAASRERGAGFTMQEPEPAPRQVTASRERGEGFTTEPAAPPPAPRPSEGLSANQLDQRLADYGLSKAQRNRLVGREKKAAALDKLEQEAVARGDQPAPRGAEARESAPAPRGAEAREPAPAARPSEGMSHKALGEALEKLGLSKKEVNRFVNKVQRAAEYDRLTRSEDASLERLRTEKEAPAKAGAVAEETERAKARREAAATQEEAPTTVRTVMEAGPDETKGHPAGEREDRAWRKLEPERTAEGNYKGAPDGVTKPRHLKGLRNLLHQLIKEGEKGRFWYEDSTKKIIEITRGNLKETERLTGLVAIYSPQRRVFENMNLAIKAYEQWKRGDPIRVGTESQDTRAYNWLEHGQDWGGRKTNNFYTNLMHELVTEHPDAARQLNIPADVLAAIKGATVDLWVLRALGYKVDAAGGTTGSGALGSARDKYGFSEREIKRAAGELNVNVPVGGQRWLPHQVQAALWSAIKARFELDSVVDATWAESLKAGYAKMLPDKTGKLVPTAPSKNGPERQGHMAIWRKHALAAAESDVAAAMDTARGSFSDAVSRIAQNITWEAIPATFMGHPINKASRAAREQFTREALSLILDKNGNDLIAAELGVNLNYSRFGSGSFEGAVNPNIITSLVPEKPPGIFDATKAEQYARAIQYIFRQDVVPYFRADRAHSFAGDFAVISPEGRVVFRYDSQAEAQAYADKNRYPVIDEATKKVTRFATEAEALAYARKKDSRRSFDGPYTVTARDKALGLHLEFDSSLDEVAQTRLREAIEAELGPYAGFTKTGDREAVVINFRGDDNLPFIDDVAFHSAVEKIARRDDIDVARVTKFGSEGQYGPVWKDASGGAEGFAVAAGGSPAFQRWIRDRHEAFGKLLDDWSTDPEARLAGGSGEVGGRGGRTSLELPQARAPPDARAAKIARLKELGEQIKPFAAKEYLTAAETRLYERLNTEAAELRFETTRPLTPDQVRASDTSTLSPEAVAAAHNDMLKSRPGYRALMDAIAGAHYDADNAIDRIMWGQNKDISASDFYHQFDQTRAALWAQYGDTVPLFRAEGQQRVKPTTNWATTRAFAEQFGPNVVQRNVPIENILAVNIAGRGRYHELIVGDLPPGVSPLPRRVQELSPEQASREQRNQPTAESPLGRVMKDERVNASVREAIDAGGSLHDGLRAIANNPFINKRLPHVAAYARTMLRLAPDLPLRPSETVRRGAFVSEENLATGRRSEHVEVREKSAEVLLHEATHGTVGHYIDSLQPGSREFQVLTTIRDEFRRGAEAHGRLGDEQVAYALSNPHELHAMLRTNPEMHDLMRGIVPTAEYRARMAQLGYPVGPAKSLWQSFVRFIRQALKLPQNVTSLMDHVMRPLDDIAEAGARFNRDLPASTRDSTVYRRGWEQEPLARTEHELPSFSDVRDKYNEIREGRAGNVGSGFRRGIRQGMPMEQIIGFNRHLFQSSHPGEGNHLDTINRAAEGVERVSREYGEKHQAAVNAAIKNLNPESNHVMTEASRLDMNPAHPPNHPLNSHSKATADEFKKVVADYNKLSAAQKKVVTDTFDLTRQQRVDRGDAAMRGIGKAYLEGVTDAQVETMVRQIRTMDGVNEILANDTNPVARAFGAQYPANRDFVKAIAREWKRGWINNYVPLHRNGDWVVTYTDPDSGNPGMLSRFTRREAETARQKLIDEGAEPSLVLSRERRTPSDIPRLSIVDEFAAKLERKFGPEGRAQADAARELLTKVMLDQSRFAGTMRKRLGVHGADPSKLPEAMSQNFLALKNAMGHLEYGPQYDAGLAAMRRHVGEMGRGANTVKVRGENPTSADVIQAQQVMEEFRRRRPVSEDPNNILLKGVNNATMFTYFKFLASPAQTVMNGIETYMQGIPRIGAQFGLGRATTAMARASAEIMPRQFARGLAGTKDVALRQLDPGEWNSANQIRDHLIQNSRRNDAAGITALFKRLEDGNLIGYSSYRDLQNMAKGTTGRVRGAVDMATDFVSILHNKMEDANRAVTALAAYDVHLQKHGDRAAAIDYADRILRTSQPNFNLSNKPRFATPQGSFGAWGIPVAQFRQHGMWAYSQMALDIRNAFKGADAATKAEARYALAFTIGMQTALLGTLNWLADPLRYLWGAYDFLSGGKPQNHEHDFRVAAAKIFGTTGGELFSRGLSRGLGYGPDISHRVGMINPLLVPEFKGSFTNPQDVTYAAVTALAGVPAIGAGSEVLTGLANFGAGNITQAVTDLVPKIIRDPIKAVRGETEGQVSRRGNVQQTPEQISTLDTVYQVFGFKSARQGERSEQTGSQRQLLDQVRTSREAATKEAARVLSTGSVSERRAAAQMVQQHNDKYPGSKIDFKDVAEYRKQQLLRLRDPTLTGITVPKGLQPAVRQAGAFANY